MNDQESISRVLAGNTNAFSFLVRRHQQQAFRLAMSIVKEEAEAKDVVQESFLRAFNALRQFRSDANFATWLGRIVINQGLSSLTRRKRKRDQETNNVHQSTVSRTVANEAVVRLKKEYLREIIRHVLLELPPRQAIVLQLFYLEEYSLEEVVATTGFSLANVKVLLHRARKRSYAILSDRYGMDQFDDLD